MAEKIGMNSTSLSQYILCRKKPLTNRRKNFNGYVFYEGNWANLEQIVGVQNKIDSFVYFGYDIAEYPDSDKILLAPSFKIFNKDSQVNYFKGDKNTRDNWKQIKNNKE